MKSNKGFTLVELIVVIAILAILAGIAIPAYSGYVAKAEKTKDTAKLESIQTAALAAASLNGENGIVEITAANGVITQVVLSDNDANTNTDPIVYPAANPATNLQKDFADFYTGNDFVLSVDENKNATIVENNGEWVATPAQSGNN